jgi:hypothetical protein
MLLAAALGAALAQTGKSITLRVLNGKSGEKVTPDNIQVRFKSNGKIQTTWVKQDDDGDAEVAIPEGATAISFKATYDNSMAYYINCDVARQKETRSESWYPIADIFSGGIKIPNECIKEKDADKVKVDVKPGEFVLFVRKKNWVEGGTQD